jgi:hypothetical protein
VSLIEIIIYNILFIFLFMSIDNPDLVQREADLLPLHFEKYPDGDSLREWFAMLTTCDALVQGRFDN